MKTTDLLLRLDHYQRVVLSTFDQVDALLDRPPQDAREPLARMRWTLARQLREYQLFKHTEIFDVALRHGGPAQVQRARDMAAHCRATGAMFQAHVVDWARRDMVTEWATFRPTMLALGVRTRRALAGEKAGVVVLLAGSDCLRGNRV